MSAIESGFWSTEEKDLAEKFLRDGYVVLDADDRNALDCIRDLVADLVAAFLKMPTPVDKDAFLNNIHERVDPDRLNDLRLAVIRGMNAHDWVRLYYFRTARRVLETIVGNELAMQLRINLSIQMPHDDSSLLPVHADVWSGDSPYEVVLWIPYVDVYATKSMFILPIDKDVEHQKRMASEGHKSADDLFCSIEEDVRWLDISYGKILVFTQNLMHGNVVNNEATTRWSSNCRFKSVFSPYRDKKLGEFFEPILIRPATRLGAAYKLPGV